MDITIVDKDIRVLCVTATSFPEGLTEAHNRLYALVPYSEGRKYCGVSRHEDGIIVYHAAAEEMWPGEAESLQCHTLVLKQGAYAFIMVYDYQGDIPAISRAFDELLVHPDVDPDEYCVELFTSSTDLQCMVRLRETVFADSTT